MMQLVIMLNMNLNFDVVRSTSEVPSSSQDFVLSTLVLEHAECLVCELRARQLHRNVGLSAVSNMPDVS